MDIVTDTTDTLNAMTPKWKRNLKISLWSLLAFVLLVFFTALKIPEDRIKNYLYGSLSSALAPYGYSLSIESSSLSFWFGMTYTINGVRIMPPPPASPIALDSIEVSPKLLSLLFFKTGAYAHILQKKGATLDLNASSNLTGSSVSIDAKFSKLDLGELSVVPLATQAMGGIKASGIGTGNLSLSGNPQVPSTLEGEFNIHLDQIVVDQQTLFGIQVPRLFVSGGDFVGVFDKSKLTYKKGQLGKLGSEDDVKLQLSGETVLGRTWQTSNNNLKANISFSQNVLKAFLFLDALIGAAKQPDGSYGFVITGPMNNSTIAPNKP